MVHGLVLHYVVALSRYLCHIFQEYYVKVSCHSDHHEMHELTGARFWRVSGEDIHLRRTGARA